MLVEMLVEMAAGGFRGNLPALPLGACGVHGEVNIKTTKQSSEVEWRILVPIRLSLSYYSALPLFHDLGYDRKSDRRNSRRNSFAGCLRRGGTA